jgi:hypothetical protein
MTSWQLCFRIGFVPSLSTAGLQALAEALERDDPRLIQGATTTPPPLACLSGWSVEAACPIGFCGWQGDGLATVAEVEVEFAQACFAADRRLDEPGGCRWFLNWADETPRDEMRRELLPEVRRELTLREADLAPAVLYCPECRCHYTDNCECNI